MKQSSFSFTDSDHAIVAELRRNGRANNREIAQRLGVTAQTVSARIKRMEQANQLRVVVVSDFEALGYRALVRLAVESNGRSAKCIARDLANLSEVFAVHVVTGRYSVDALLALPDFSKLAAFLEKTASSIKGIRSMAPSIIVDIPKYQFDIAPIESEGT